MMRMIVGEKRCNSVNCEYSFLLLHRCKGFVHLNDVSVRQFLELGTRELATLAQRSTRGKKYVLLPVLPSVSRISLSSRSLGGVYGVVRECFRLLVERPFVGCSWFLRLA